MIANFPRETETWRNDAASRGGSNFCCAARDALNTPPGSDLPADKKRTTRTRRFASRLAPRRRSEAAVARIKTTRRAAPRQRNAIALHRFALTRLRRSSRRSSSTVASLRAAAVTHSRGCAAIRAPGASFKRRSFHNVASLRAAAGRHSCASGRNSRHLLLAFGRDLCCLKQSTSRLVHAPRAHAASRRASRTTRPAQSAPRGPSAQSAPQHRELEPAPV